MNRVTEGRVPCLVDRLRERWVRVNGLDKLFNRALQAKQRASLCDQICRMLAR